MACSDDAPLTFSPGVECHEQVHAMPNSAAVIQWARVSRGGGGDDTGTANSRRSGSIQSSDVLINFLKEREP
jgi:hypothetical protein